MLHRSGQASSTRYWSRVVWDLHLQYTVKVPAGRGDHSIRVCQVGETRNDTRLDRFFIT